MFTITEYSVELIKDPFGILAGTRYEFLLDLDVPEDDELHTESGVYLRVVYSVEDNRERIVKYEFLDRQTNQYLDFEMDEEEEKQIEAFCKEHVQEAVR
ncbi:DUF6509 family protein [Paenibacillus allorhizosphaerae]|uniref:Pullulanase n=1 Tax=Paenibacillus allorhizosphaerae TaxID=2849866 RepID=A0ABM8VFR1_9BACL|nr:DUF6509 family protein [Paenibacillus allorhizosphaerae]CAG7635723.1 hypothetical protein PAECIP111802_02172 [Paenibacillus allorhizosphaerae]